jgi:hypothetical protein
MYKKLLIVLVFINMAIITRAQVTFSLQVPPIGVVQKSQLWNMVLVYTGDVPADVYVGLSFLSVKDNRPVMTATTRPFVLTNGARQLSAVDISPVQYNYLSSVFDVDRNPDGFLPIGNYKACYTIYRTDKNITTPLAEDCIPVEVQPLSPPLLNTPADAGAIETPYPQFTWLPAVPLNLFSNLNYDLLVVEVLPGQTKGDAIQKNLPVYNIDFCKTPFNNYPASNKSLDTGRTYAWRVVAKNDNDFVAQSEVWTFKVNAKNKLKVDTANISYSLIQNDLDGVCTINGNVLHVKYVSSEGAFESIVSFTDETGRVMQEQKQKMVQGDNYLDFKIGKRFEAGKIYQIAVTGLDRKKHVLRFSIKKN